MKNTKLKQMEELDAKIEKTNYDLSGLESRKKFGKILKKKLQITSKI